jgi:hypothetical protein
MRVSCALIKTAQQKKYNSHHGQDANRHPGGDFPNVLCGLGL